VIIPSLASPSRRNLRSRRVGELNEEDNAKNKKRGTQTGR